MDDLGVSFRKPLYLLSNLIWYSKMTMENPGGINDFPCKCPFRIGDFPLMIDVSGHRGQVGVAVARQQMLNDVFHFTL